MTDTPDTNIFQTPDLARNADTEGPRIPNINKISPEFQKKLNEVSRQAGSGTENIRSIIKSEMEPQDLNEIQVIGYVEREIQKEVAGNMSYHNILNVVVSRLVEKTIGEAMEDDFFHTLRARAANDLDGLFKSPEAKIKAILRVFGMSQFTEEELKNFPITILQDFLKEEMEDCLEACLDAFRYCATCEQNADLQEFTKLIKIVVIKEQVPTNHGQMLQYRSLLARKLQACLDFMPTNTIVNLPEDITYAAAIAKIQAGEMQNPHWIQTISVRSYNDFKVSKRPFTLALKVKGQKERDTDRFMRGGYRIIQKEVENS